MEKGKIIKYIELRNKFEKNLKDENAPKLTEKDFTEEEKIIISEGNQALQTNQELINIIRLPLEQREKMIEQMKIEEKQKVGISKEEQAIKEVYGFDIKNIENKNLENGTEIFKFYTPKLGKTVILENRKDKSLSEQLKEMQSQYEQFRTSDEKQNTNDMLEKERQKDNVELDMISPNDLDQHRQELDGLTDEEKNKINYIMVNKDKYHVKSINIKNQIYLDENDDVREIVINKENGEPIVQEPNSLNYNEEQINVSGRMNESLSTQAQLNELSDEYEDNPIEKEEIDEYEKLDQDIKNQIDTYRDYPELLNSLNEEERKKWQHYIDLYDEHHRKIYGEEAPKVKKMVPPNSELKKAGYIDVLFLSIITLITISLVFLISYQVYK